MDYPQILQYCAQPVNYVICDTKWIPQSTRFVVLGNSPHDRGVINIFESSMGYLIKVKEVLKPIPMKCATFGHCNFTNRHIAVGDVIGQLQVFDLEVLERPIFYAKDHKGMINCIDGFGGKNFQCGFPQIVTGSSDGTVKVWDIRQSTPVVNITPQTVSYDPTVVNTKDCWAVGFGNSFNNCERVIAIGYDTGNLKLFDMRAMAVRWEITLRSSICGLEFDRREIPMNKLGAVTEDGRLHMFNMRTQHPTKGFTRMEEKNTRLFERYGVIVGIKATTWNIKHLPQNRDMFVTIGGNGSLRLWDYDYPERSVINAEDGYSMGVLGSLNLLSVATLSKQPIHTFDWHPDRAGLAVCGSFDSNIRVLVTTKMASH